MRRRALIVSNGDFLDSANYPKLMNSRNDANDLSYALHKYCSFRTTKLIDEDVHTIREAIEGLYLSCDRQDITLFYFSGHGDRDPRTRDFHLVVKDTRRERPLSTGITVSFIREAMRKSRARYHIIILDCCYSEAFIKGQKGGGNGGIRDAVADELRGEASAILTSSSASELSSESGGRNSIFTKYLIKGIQTWYADSDRDGCITITEWFDYASEQIKIYNHPQTPAIQLNKRGDEVCLSRRDINNSSSSISLITRIVLSLSFIIALAILLVIMPRDVGKEVLEENAAKNLNPTPSSSSLQSKQQSAEAILHDPNTGELLIFPSFDLIGSGGGFSEFDIASNIKVPRVSREQTLTIQYSGFEPNTTASAKLLSITKASVIKTWSFPMDDSGDSVQHLRVERDWQGGLYLLEGCDSNICKHVYFEVSAHFGEVFFCDANSWDSVREICTTGLAYLPFGITTLYASWSYNDMKRSDIFELKWYHNREFYYSKGLREWNDAWEKDPTYTGTWLANKNSPGQPLPSGLYKVELFFEGVIESVGAVTVETIEN